MSSLGPCVARVGGLVMLSFVARPVVAFVPYAPVLLSNGRGGSCVWDTFLPVASGVVSSLGWDASSRSFLVSLSGGRSFSCRSGRFPSDESCSLLAGSLRSALRSGASVTLVGAPGPSGRVLPGFFCGLVAADRAVSLQDALLSCWE